MANPTMTYGPNMYSTADQPGGIYKWWGNMGSDLFANLPSLICAIDPKRCQGDNSGGNTPPVVVKENNTSTILLVGFGFLAVIILIVFLTRR